MWRSFDFLGLFLHSKALSYLDALFAFHEYYTFTLLRSSINSSSFSSTRIPSYYVFIYSNVFLIQKRLHFFLTCFSFSIPFCVFFFDLLCTFVPLYSTRAYCRPIIFHIFLSLLSLHIQLSTCPPYLSILMLYNHLFLIFFKTRSRLHLVLYRFVHICAIAYVCTKILFHLFYTYETFILFLPSLKSLCTEFKFQSVNQKYL